MPSLWLTRWWRKSASLTWSPMVCSGDSEIIGSWKIIEMWRPRILRRTMPSGLSLVMSRGGLLEPGAAKSILPEEMRAVLGRMPIIACAVTDLPDPDSPTSATVEPARMRNEIPFSAGTIVPRLSNSTERSSTSIRSANHLSLRGPSFQAAKRHPDPISQHFF